MRIIRKLLKYEKTSKMIKIFFKLPKRLKCNTSGNERNTPQNF